LEARTSIRQAAWADVSAIVRIEKKSFGRDAWTREAFLGYFDQPEDCIFLVATTNGKVAGYIIGFQRGAHAEVDSVAVGPSHRRLGVAAALLKRLKRVLRRRGLTSVSLAVRLNNTGAIQLYRRLGFRRDRRINGYYEDGAPAWRMKAPLAE
jgi:ribosomal-protein-alanine N-acetyltransferase